MSNEFVKGADGVWRRAEQPTSDTPITDEQRREAAQAAEQAEAEGIRAADEAGVPQARYADDVLSEQTAEQRLEQALEGELRTAAGEGVFDNPEAVRGALGYRDHVGAMVGALRGQSDALERVDENGTRWLLVNDSYNKKSGWVTQDEYESMPGTYQRVGETDEARATYLENRIGTLSERGREALRQSLTAGQVGALTMGNVATAGLLMDAADNNAARARLRLASEGSPLAATIGGLAGEISSMATLGATARIAAGALGATRGASALKGIRSYLGARATAAASSSATRGAALAALNAAGKLAPLSADAALGEMQAARAQAALNNAELTSSQLLGAAGTGVAWGLGLGVGAAMMRGGYRISREQLAKMRESAAGELLTNSQTASVPPPAPFKDLSEWRRKLRDGGEGAQQQVRQWIDANKTHLDPRVVEAWERSPADFAETLRKATTTTGMKLTEQALDSLEKMEARLREVELSAPSTGGPVVSAEAIALGAQKRKGKSVSRPATMYGNEIGRLSPGLLERSDRVMSAARSAVTDVITELGNAAARGNEIAGGWFSTSAGKQLRDELSDLLTQKKRPGAVMHSQTKSNRNLGNAYLGMNEAGNFIQAAMKNAPQEARQVLQKQLDTLRGRQLGTADRSGIFGDFGANVTGNQGALQSLQGARARLFGVQGADNAEGLVGRNGKPDPAMIRKARQDQGVNLSELGEALNDYQKQLSAYVDSAPVNVKDELLEQTASLNKLMDEIRPGLNARGLARSLYEEGRRVANDTDGVFIQAEAVIKPPLPADAVEALDPPTFREKMEDLAGTSAADFAISMLPNWVKEPVNLARRLVTKTGATGKVLDAADQWATRLDNAIEDLQPVLKRAKKAGVGKVLSPARIGAAVTRGGGIPTTTEIDRMSGDEKRKTFEALRDDIEGLIQNPSFAAGMAAMASEGAMQASPNLAAALQQQMTRGLFYLAEEMPRGSIDPLNPGSPGQVSVGEMQSWLTRYRAINDPLVMIKDLGEGRLRTETAESIQAVYPDVFAEMVLRVSEQMVGQDVPFSTRIQVGLMLGIPGDKLMTGPALLSFQQNYAGAQTPEQAQVMGLNERRAAQAAARMPA
ncbi:MAG: hypothetical protein ACTSX8_02450, partial [Alphaproteobacteria bacterium]